jgi:HPt (histidine-containing phosphotransfer) domain-containing protein
VVAQESKALQERCMQLEKELRARKREGEKLQALHYRLKNDLREAGGDLR